MSKSDKPADEDVIREEIDEAGITDPDEIAEIEAEGAEDAGAKAAANRAGAAEEKAEAARKKKQKKAAAKADAEDAEAKQDEAQAEAVAKTDPAEAKRKKAEAKQAAAQARSDRRAAKIAEGPNPTWWVPTMCGLMLLGLFWLVVYYLSSEKFPVPGIGLGNMGIGFGLILVGFAMTTRWR